MLYIFIVAATPREAGAIPSPAVELLGVPIWGLTLEGFVALARARLRARQKTLFTTAPGGSVVLASRMPELHAHFRAADVVLPDGMLTVWSARLVGARLAARVTGPDFAAALLGEAEREGFGVFFLGSTDDVLGAIRRNLRARHPRLRVCGTLAPPFGELDGETDRRLIGAVNAAAPDILFVGMTCPRQELWLSRCIDRLVSPFSMGIGYAFDLLAGSKRRAPAAVGRVGLEWAWRLAHEPRRMWRRTLTTGMLPLLVLRERVLGRATHH
jgi:N-acetylglucosaminyldiphosphoundecaprenol N-acetyl-beta-D-mannosaminyltransferase